jgi:hypothetical protein
MTNACHCAVCTTCVGQYHCRLVSILAHIQLDRWPREGVVVRSNIHALRSINRGDVELELVVLDMLGKCFPGWSQCFAVAAQWAFTARCSDAKCRTYLLATARVCVCAGLQYIQTHKPRSTFDLGVEVAHVQLDNVRRLYRLLGCHNVSRRLLVLQITIVNEAKVAAKIVVGLVVGVEATTIEAATNAPVSIEQIVGTGDVVTYSTNVGNDMTLNRTARALLPSPLRSTSPTRKSVSSG